MFVRLTTYLKALARAERAEGQWQEAVKRAASVEKALRYEREEVRRLTDLIATMRSEGLLAGPGHGAPEQTWGKYSLDEVEQEMVAGDGAGFASSSPTSEQDAALDAEIRAELEDVLSDE